MYYVITALHNFYEQKAILFLNLSIFLLTQTKIIVTDRVFKTIVHILKISYFGSS